MNITTTSSMESSSQTDAQSLAALCKAAGDPLRLEILRMLRHNAFGVLELSEILEVSQSGMSHHLKVLSTVGLINARREGNSLFYRRATLTQAPEMQQFQHNLFAACDRISLPAPIRERIVIVNRERARASQEFFRENAGDFRENQDLIASFLQYGDSIVELLDATPLVHHRILEVGPGEGELLALLSSRFREVVALDNSREMLDRACQFAKKHHLENISFILGDTGQPSRLMDPVDCITLNMVLHHNPVPAQLFIDLVAILKPGGAMIITELCHHDQDWTRDACGDLWQGFDPDDLTMWAVDAGLVEGESLFFAQRNGFRVQLRQFFKPEATEQTLSLVE